VKDPEKLYKALSENVSKCCITLENCTFGTNC